MALTKNLVAVELMKHLVDHGNHGYSQYSREGDGTGTHPVVVDGRTYYVRNGDRDCSSAVIDALTMAGIDCGGATYTGNMRRCMTATGNFVVKPMTFSAQPGDVYLNDVNHTAMCLSPYGSAEGDILGEFSISENGTIDGAEGDQTGWESHRRAYYDYPWNCILHYTGKADGTPMPEPQEPVGNTANVNVTYALRRLRDAQWHADVVNFNNSDSEGYAGEPNTEHDLLTISVDRGSVRYRTMNPDNSWNDWVHKADKGDTVNGCAGIPGTPICGVQVYYETPAGEGYQQAWYRSQTTKRAGWLDVCCDDGNSWPGYDGWAGMCGEPLDRLQLKIAPSDPF